MFRSWIWLHMFVVFVLFHVVSSQSIIKTLPGYSGTLPFRLETGYITVGEGDDVELFYYFIESERNPGKDPLVLWLTGGPGCSGLCGLAFEIGPIAFDASTFNGSLPSFIQRPHSWTKIANVIFIDAPVGTGFSYATKEESYYMSDTRSAKDTYMFLRKWLLKHPMFIDKPLYISGDSYGGKMVPIVVSEIYKGNEAGLEPQMLLQGYTVGNPLTDEQHDTNGRIPYAHRMGLISDEYYELAKSSCSGEYVNPDPSNGRCLHAVQLINKCIKNIYIFHVLEPDCLSTPQKRSHMLLEDVWLNTQHWEICRDRLVYMMSHAWANDPKVRDALHVRRGTTGEWRKCNNLTSVYEKDVENSFQYHQVLSKTKLQALVYSGDHDMSVPHITTLQWVKNLNLTLDEDWRPWKVDEQVAGYTEKYKNKEFSLTFATVKGAGHTVPEYKPRESQRMVKRWFSSFPL